MRSLGTNSLQSGAALQLQELMSICQNEAYPDFLGYLEHNAYQAERTLKAWAQIIIERGFNLQKCIWSDKSILYVLYNTPHQIANLLIVG